MYEVVIIFNKCRVPVKVRAKRDIILAVYSDHNNACTLTHYILKQMNFTRVFVLQRQRSVAPHISLFADNIFPTY